MRRRGFDTRFCARCRCQREFSKRTAAHLWHLGLTILTFGLWGIGWIAVAMIESRRPWRCTICHSRFVPGGETQISQTEPMAEPRIKLPVAPRRR